MKTKVRIPKPVDASDQKELNSTEFAFCLLSFEKEITAWGLSTEDKYPKQLSQKQMLMPLVSLNYY